MKGDEAQRCTTEAGTPDYCPPNVYPGVADRLYRNLGDGTFEDIGSSSGIADFASPGLGVICHDLDFPELLRQASSEKIGLLVGPSDDWVDVASLHGRMAVFRAVENGFTLLRPTNGGRSVAVDTRGRVIAEVNSPDDVMVAHVSARSSRTLYGTVGDLFSWLCLIGLAFLAVGRNRAG